MPIYRVNRNVAPQPPSTTLQLIQTLILQKTIVQALKNNGEAA